MNYDEFGYERSCSSGVYGNTCGTGYCQSCGNYCCTGCPGPRGPQGLQGPIGPMGPMGPMGPRGFQGATGVAGVTGATGATGITGAAGASPVISVAGTRTGAPGTEASVDETFTSTGAQLLFTIPAGVTGAAGADGTTGPTGADGAMGPTGPTGADGVTGPTGARGTSITAITLTLDTGTGAITGGTATLDDGTTTPIAVTTA